MRTERTLKPITEDRYLPMQNKNILIMAGGTGGHVYPALAVADTLKLEGFKLFWLGSNNGLEKNIVPKHGYTLLKINVKGIRGKGIFHLLSAPFFIVASIFQALLVMVKIRPVIVLGMGGFASGPGGIAAWLMRIPLLIHEQNSIAGLTNRLLSPFAVSVMTAFPEVFKNSDKTIITGNPIRYEIEKISKPENRYINLKSKELRILVLGGSLGAEKLNKIVPATISSLGNEYVLKVKHQCGEKNFSKTQSIYKDYNLNIDLTPYIDDMVHAYTWADLVICRAGASTISEITACGIASILIPYPFAVDNHQMSNAKYLSDQGAAILIEEEKCNIDKLKNILLDFINTPDLLLGMAKKAKNLSKPEATNNVAKLCIEVFYA
ncbi:MAG: undecaprenyldiphospho-muramoylpentapeptide beta-N-acetylglucosaminyltransferase [Legionellales bacterium]|nr:undecaprenyldiphospho-muramoylpentapeptide beta-N-acetylglucosaminyltransferase [Legionellales bacterium]